MCCSVFDLCRVFVCWLFVVRCCLFDLFVAVLVVVRCSVACCVLIAVCHAMSLAEYYVFVPLFAVCCLCCSDRCFWCLLFAVLCSFCVACCLLFFVCCVMCGGWLCALCCLFVDGCVYIDVCCVF